MSAGFGLVLCCEGGIEICKHIFRKKKKRIRREGSGREKEDVPIEEEEPVSDVEMEEKSGDQEFEAQPTYVDTNQENLKNQSDKKLKCSICFVNDNNICFDPCGHLSCEDCYEKLSNCHLCRRKILKVIKMYY